MADGAAVLVLVHDDGHVGLIADGAVTTTDRLRSFARLLGKVGIGGWQVEHMGSMLATIRLVEGLNCGVCRIVYPCGCTIERMGAGQCTHGTADVIHRAAHEVGHCSDTDPRHLGPPLTQTGDTP